MRYFRMTEQWGDKPMTLWQKREDGLERCIYDPEDVYGGEDTDGRCWYTWTNPSETEDLTVLIESDPENVIEITEGDLFVEMV